MQFKHFLICLILYVLSPSTIALTVDEAFYKKHSSPLDEFQVKLQQAEDADKLMLLIVGADWCHDSRALADQLQSNVVMDVLDDSYTVMIIDAGWLSDLSEVLNPLGHPAYFGTPSLFIIEPEHEIILNRGSIQRWQSAHSESDTSLAHYLSIQNNNAVAKTQQILNRKSEHKEVLERIFAFEKHQAERLYHAYSIIGPKLAAESETGHVNELDRLWEEVRRYRYKLQHDLALLYQSVDSGEVALPEYEQLSFE